MKSETRLYCIYTNLELENNRKTHPNDKKSTFRGLLAYKLFLSLSKIM